MRACPAWSLRICLTSRELSAKDGEGGPLGTLADIASSVHGVLARLGDGGVLGALSDSVEPAIALRVLMNINESWHGDAPTMTL